MLSSKWSSMHTDKAAINSAIRCRIRLVTNGLLRNSMRARRKWPAVRFVFGALTSSDHSQGNHRSVSVRRRHLDARRRAGKMSGRRRPTMREQLFYAGGRVCRQPGQHVLEVSPRIVAVQLRRHDEAHDYGGALAGQFASGEYHDLRPTAHGRIWFSMWLLSTGTLPSRRFAVSAVQWFKL